MKPAPTGLMHHQHFRGPRDWKLKSSLLPKFQCSHHDQLNKSYIIRYADALLNCNVILDDAVAATIIALVRVLWGSASASRPTSPHCPSAAAYTDRDCHIITLIPLPGTIYLIYVPRIPQPSAHPSHAPHFSPKPLQVNGSNHSSPSLFRVSCSSQESAVADASSYNFVRFHRRVRTEAMLLRCNQDANPSLVS